MSFALKRVWGVAFGFTAQAAADNGKPVRGKDVLSSAEREELVRLRRQLRQVQQVEDL